MGWLRLGADVLAGNPDVVDLVTRNPYDNSWADGWPFFRIASVLGTGSLPHRATTFGLPGLVAVVLLVVACLGRRPAGVLLAGVLAALLAPFHFYAFPATYLIVLAYVLFAGGWRQRTVWRDGLLFLAPVVLAVPYVLPAALRQGSQGAFRFVEGWSEARFADGPAAAAFFYVTNLGIPVLIARRRAVRPARHAGGAPTRLPDRLARRALPDPQRRGGQRGRVRHEQVLPDHVDRGRDPRGLVAGPLAALAGRRGDRDLRPCHRPSSRSITRPIRPSS